MKLLSILSILFFSVQITCAQEIEPHLVKDSDKGKLYFYWGWNGEGFSKSDIKFEGADYSFRLDEVEAKDRQSKLGLDPYFYPRKFTIPQYNFRIGYAFKSNWDISFGVDHMKYVVQNNQTVAITGNIMDTNSDYFGTYDQDPILITKDFLLFEHTDGLNYVNFELRRFDQLAQFKMIKINLTEGVGLGGMYTKTNTTLMNKEKYDEFQVTGFGFDAVVGLNISIFNRFFVQCELKGGYINMPDIRTTISELDSANHTFFFLQNNIVFGMLFKIK